MTAHPLLFVLAGLLIAFLFFDVLSLSLTKLGLSPWAALLVFIASIAGSVINIPVWRSQVTQPGQRFQIHHIFFYQPPSIADQVIAINVGGAVIPVLLNLWLLPRAPFLRTVIATVAVAVVAHLAATPVPGRGIEMPIWIAPLAAALIALVLTFGRRAAPVAYISGTIGTLIGADLTNLGTLQSFGPGVLSIGGAGVFDGVFLVGIVAALISFDRPSRPKYAPSTSDSGR